MEVTPDLHFLDSKEADNVGWHNALAELIDNALDAGGTRVEIELNGRSLSITDDGTGVADMTSMVKFGSHRRQKTTSVGQYGVGLKDAWFFFGPRMLVESIHRGTRTTLAIDRSEIRMVDGRWIAPDPISADCQRASGTRVCFDPLKTGRGRPEDQTLQKLGWTFLPALESGRQIIYLKSGKRKPIAPCKLPQLTERVETSLVIDGKAASLSVGIMADGQRNPYPSLWVCYGHRIVLNTSMGCGPYSAARIAGIIRLERGWKLTPHKDDLAEYSEELDAAIFEAIEPMLKKAARLIEDIESSELRANLEKSLNEALSAAKAKEKRPGDSDASGTVEPKKTAGRRRKATAFDIELPGSVEALGDEPGKKRVRGVKLDWCNIHPDRIGEYDALAKVVKLNLDNDFIAHAKRHDNQEALRSVALGLVCHHDSINDGRQRLLVEKRDFIASWGLVMASLKFEERTNGKK